MAAQPRRISTTAIQQTIIHKLKELTRASGNYASLLQVVSGSPWSCIHYLTALSMVTMGLKQLILTDETVIEKLLRINWSG